MAIEAARRHKQKYCAKATSHHRCWHVYETFSSIFKLIVSHSATAPHVHRNRPERVIWKWWNISIRASTLWILVWSTGASKVIPSVTQKQGTVIFINPLLFTQMIHGSKCDIEIWWGQKCPTRAVPSCDIFNRGSSYLNVALTVVLHLFCHMTNH